MFCTGQPAGQGDHVEGLIEDVVEQGIGLHASAARPLDQTGLQTGADHLDAGAAQQISKRDRLQVFKPRRQWNQYAFHVGPP
jgi:3-methyladenine DNA glycosylase/8-oxoguanine DNA glycosylase